MHGWGGWSGVSCRGGEGGCKRGEGFMSVSGCGSGVKLEHASMPILAFGIDVHLDSCLRHIPCGLVH